MTIYNVFSLLGGLAMFLYGMMLLGDGLEKRAGRRLKTILEGLTANPARGVLLGAAVTAVIQSSSATTVMLVGFVNSGIMQLKQAISVIMGANIGTTATAWLLSLVGIESDNFWVTLLKPTTFSPILAFVGIILLFVSKRNKGTATVLLGFAILMFGMDMMSGAVKGLANVPEFINILTMFSNPLFGVLAGALVTAAIQSSSASVGILQAIASTGALQYGSAIPIIFGQNIGTCITALLSSIGANKSAKRVAMAHLSFNIIGTITFLILYSVLNAIFRFAFNNEQATMVGIAIVHSLFNTLTTIILFPFLNQLEKLAHGLVKEGKETEVFEMLDDRLIGTPPIAIERCRLLTGEMAALSRDTFLMALEQLGAYNEKRFEDVIKSEDSVDVYEDRLGSYLVKVSMRSLSDSDSRETSKLLHMIGDFERICDHAVNIVEAAQEMHDKSIHFSEAAQNEVAVLSAAVTEILTVAVGAFIDNDILAASGVEPLEQVVDTLVVDIKGRHVRRLQTGECTIELGFVLADILADLERVADHCSNIAISVIEIETHGALDLHEYIRKIESGQSGADYNEIYARYSEKYSID
ncbi:MAG: Na/Pi cotransporter family protein [Oscillospiraceae bacterium]|nr:Na/Pi cotransporter family protein [Oscillospiraceae bacterium]